jgi:hypothetical protein
VKRYVSVPTAHSDPGLIRFFLRFLDAAGVSRDDLVFTVSIHESADVEAAHGFWREATGARHEQFRKPAIKHHNPRTTRKNVGDTYHGCLAIRVRRGSKLYRKIEGWASAAVRVVLPSPRGRRYVGCGAHEPPGIRLPR